MHILIAPNAFKNSLGATEAAEAISKGFLQSKLSCTTTCFPVADGGDGTAELLIKYLEGVKINTVVCDPLGRKIKSEYGWIEKEKTAVIELAAASGIRLLKTKEYSPLSATTYGTGELIKAALIKEARRIILCIGGSATVDGGVGILHALGIKFLNEHGQDLKELPYALTELSTIDSAGLIPSVHSAEFIILCDVENFLLGDKGAAAVFGPQKGASEDEVKKLEQGLTTLRNVLLKQSGKDIGAIKHGGAAGGVAASANYFLNAELVNGIEYFLKITGFEKELKKADMVITGEGSIDVQTLQGKGPYGVAAKAKEYFLPVIGLAGLVPEIIDTDLKKYFDQLISINEEGTDIQTALKKTGQNLERTAQWLGDRLTG